MINWDKVEAEILHNIQDKPIRRAALRKALVNNKTISTDKIAEKAITQWINEGKLFDWSLSKRNGYVALIPRKDIEELRKDILDINIPIRKVELKKQLVDKKVYPTKLMAERYIRKLIDERKLFEWSAEKRNCYVASIPRPSNWIAPELIKEGDDNDSR